MKNKSNLIFLSAILLTTIFMGSSFPTGKYLIAVEKTPPLLIPRIDLKRKRMLINQHSF